MSINTASSGPDQQKTKISINSFGEYEKEKFQNIKDKLTYVISWMDAIEVSLAELDELGVVAKSENKIKFDTFYNTHMKETEMDKPINYRGLIKQLQAYQQDLQYQIQEAKKQETEFLKEQL